MMLLIGCMVVGRSLVVRSFLGGCLIARNSRVHFGGRCVGAGGGGAAHKDAAHVVGDHGPDGALVTLPGSGIWTLLARGGFLAGGSSLLCDRVLV